MVRPARSSALSPGPDKPPMGGGGGGGGGGAGGGGGGGAGETSDAR